MNARRTLSAAWILSMAAWTLGGCERAQTPESMPPPPETARAQPPATPAPSAAPVATKPLARPATEPTQPSQDPGTTDRQAWFHLMEAKLADFEKDEASLKAKEASWPAETREQFDRKLAALVERRVLAKRSLETLRSRDEAGLQAGKPEFQEALHKIEQAYQDIQQFSR